MIDQLRSDLLALRERARPLEPDHDQRARAAGMAVDHALAYWDSLADRPANQSWDDVFAQRLEPEFAEQGGELARRVVPLDVVRRLEDPGGLLVGPVTAEVAEQPRPDLPRLPDVEHPATGRKHAIDTGAILGQRAHALPEALDVAAGRKERWGSR